MYSPSTQRELKLNLSQRKYNVTATVRSPAKAEDIIRAHPDWEGKIEFAIIADFTTPKPFDVLFQNTKIPFDYVIHTASPVSFTVTDIQKDMIEPAELGYDFSSQLKSRTFTDHFRTLEIMRSAKRYGGPQLKRFVLLSSAVTVLNSFEDMTKEGKPYTEKDWNPVSLYPKVYIARR